MKEQIRTPVRGAIVMTIAVAVLILVAVSPANAEAGDTVYRQIARINLRIAQLDRDLTGQEQVIGDISSRLSPAEEISLFDRFFQRRDRSSLHDAVEKKRAIRKKRSKFLALREQIYRANKGDGGDTMLDLLSGKLIERLDAEIEETYGEIHAARSVEDRMAAEKRLIELKKRRDRKREEYIRYSRTYGEYNDAR